MKVAGVDLGQLQDYTAIIVLDQYMVTRILRLRLGQKWDAIVSGVLAATADCDLLAVDCTGVGAAPVESMQAKRPGVVPVRFTSSSKRSLIMGLAEAIGTRTLGIASGIDGRDDLSEELKRFAATPTRKGWNFSGKKTGKDDLVMALALAVYARGLRDVPR